MKFRKDSIIVIAHLPHLKGSDGSVSAYEPYVREIELWAEVFQNVIIYTEFIKKTPSFPLKRLPFNCEFREVYMKSGPGFKTNFIRIFQLPFVLLQFTLVLLFLKKDTLVHLRSPGITTLIFNLINRIFNKPIIVKWATQFAPMPIPNKILHWELKLLQNPPTNTKVLIYGISNNPNHISFIPALMSENEMLPISDLNLNKPFSNPIKILCVGRLFRFKEFDQVITALGYLKKEKKLLNWELNLVGDGEEMLKLKQMALENEIIAQINFLGKMSFVETCEFYSKSDISIIPGRYEGWAKVINESWSFGVIPMVTSGGNTSYPIKLSDGAGVVYNEDLTDFVEKFEYLTNLTALERREIRLKGYNANKEMTLSNFKTKLEKVINDWKS
jgi:glycosyltransferase involved in cell wall biosynthesis